MSLLKNLEQFKQKPCLVTPFVNSKPHCLLLNIGLGVRVRGLLGRVELT